jgi:HlyD family secretion protein
MTKQSFSSGRPLLFGSLALAILVGGFGSWSLFTQLSGAIISPGRIEVEQNRQVIQHPDGGVVAELTVKEGDHVQIDQVLVRLDDTELRSRLAITEGQLFELMARRGRLDAERDGLSFSTYDPELVAVATENDDVKSLMDGQTRLLEARVGTLAQQVDQLGKRKGQISSQIEGIEAQQIALNEQLALIQRELADQQSLLDRGLAQAARVLGLQREQSRLSGQVGELTAQKAQAEGRITEIDIEILQLGSSRREEAISNLRDIQYRELELAEQRRALLEQMSRLDIRSPVSGIVYDMTVFATRAVIRAAEPLLFIVPQDRPLVIKSNVETINVDQVFPGQPVVLRFSALDQRTTPELNGSVTQLSADAFTDERTGQSYYKAEIALAPGELARLPEGVTLVPGMPVEAFIRTADRTPMEYLLKPFTDYLAKAFRE